MSLSMIDSLVPAGLERFLRWNRRFQALGLPGWAAARAATSRARKQAYSSARIEHIPAPVLRDLRCVVDVGANRGQWANALLEFIKPDRIDLFEPNPDAFAQ